MSKNWNYVSGDWNVICDVCSKKIKASEAKQRWDGYIVCKDDYEQRQPLDFIRAREDKISVPFTRPIPTDVFVPSNYTESLADQVYQIEERLTRVVEYIRSFSDSFTLSDAITEYGYEEGLVDTVSFAEAFDTLLVTMLDLADSATISDTLINAIAKVYTDSVVASDELIKEIANSLTESVLTTDALVVLLNQTLGDSLLVNDVLANALSTNVLDSITLGDLLVSELFSGPVINGSSLNTLSIN